MIKKEDAILIIYPAGGYGHYMYWILNNFTQIGNGKDFSLPFDNFGGSHNQTHSNATPPSHIVHMNSFKSKFVHCHVDLEIHKEEIVLLSKENFKQYIIINDDHSSSDFFLQLMNNYFDKAKEQNLTRFVSSIKNCEDFKEFNLRSENREYISYKAFKNIKWVKKDKFKNSIQLSLSDLLYNFIFLLNELSVFLETELINKDDIIENHKKFISLQRHLNIDKEISTFLKDFTNYNDSRLPENCSIIDEAYIQHYLREELDLEIKCFELEAFPKTTTELHKISFPANELQREVID